MSFAIQLLAGFLLLKWTFVCAADLGLEPGCSKYDFEQKLFAKTIRLDTTVGDLVKRVTALEDAAPRNAPHKKTCPHSYMYSMDLNLCWRFSKDYMKVNWFDTDRVCRDDGAHLMTFNSTNAVKFIHEFLQAAGTGDIHVGASDIAEEGVFKWINGETVQQIQWLGTPPSGGTRTNCLIMRTGYSYIFTDGECSTKRSGVLCHIDLN